MNVGELIWCQNFGKVSETNKGVGVALKVKVRQSNENKAGWWLCLTLSVFHLLLQGVALELW